MVEGLEIQPIGFFPKGKTYRLVLTGTLVEDVEYAKTTDKITQSRTIGIHLFCFFFLISCYTEPPVNLLVLSHCLEELE